MAKRSRNTIVRHVLDKQRRRSVLTVRPGTSVQNASRLMAKHDVGALVVSSDGRTPEGIISERDIVKGVAKRGQDFLRNHVGDVIVHSVVTCGAGDDVYRVMQAMKEHGFRHVPVTSKGVLVGMISIVDILREQVAKKELA